MPGDAALLAAAHQALKGAVGSFVFENRPYVAKRLAGDAPGRLGRLWQDLLLGLVARRLAHAPLRPAALPPGPDYERRRLQYLAAAGQPVPPVLAWDETLMVLPYAGQDGFPVMRRLPRAERARFLGRLAAELGDFHAAGHWHGGAQIKNVLLEDERTWRIDFEEAALERLPLPLAQAYDLILFLNIIPLAGPLDEAESRDLLPRLLATYLRHQPDQAVRQCLTRILPWARRLRRLVRPFRRMSRKSIRRAEILIDCLEHELAPVTHA
ncbi:MAG: lipopolysaccharide kinase InaA family protein [Azovibrio sp.]|nr:lipopolysaccharide kinase InaA family protein [Azovibrio sp.]